MWRLGCALFFYLVVNDLAFAVVADQQRTQSPETEQKLETLEENAIPPEDYYWIRTSIGVANNVSQFSRLSLSAQFDDGKYVHGVEFGQIRRSATDLTIFEDQLSTITYVSTNHGFSGQGEWSVWQIDIGAAYAYVDNETCLASGCKLNGELEFAIPINANVAFGKIAGAGLGLSMMVYSDDVVTTLDLHLVFGDFNTW